MKLHAMRDTPPAMSEPAARIRSANRKTALVLLSIAVVFFVGIIATRFMGEGAAGISVMGTVVLLFLIVAIGRNLRSKR
ncbi:MAG: cytochrome oxidase small assembly protein [Betaproteobacteria bacterium]